MTTHVKPFRCLTLTTIEVALLLFTPLPDKDFLHISPVNFLHCHNHNIICLCPCPEIFAVPASAHAVFCGNSLFH